MEGSSYTAGSNPAQLKKPDVRRLDVKLINGSIVDVPSPAYVLGVFDNVNPTGTALYVDSLLGGTLSQLVQDRMFGSRLGEIFILPTRRQKTFAESVVFIGLGPLDSFREQILELVAENLARVLTAANMQSFTTVPIGTTAGLKPDASVKAFAAGFLRGLERNDPEHDFRSIQVCEIDETRFNSLVAALTRQIDEGYFSTRNVDVRLRTQKLETTRASHVEPAADRFPDPLYLQVRCAQSRAKDDSTLEYSILTADTGASIISRAHTITMAARNEAGARLATAKVIDGDLGRALAGYYMPAETVDMMANHLKNEPNRQLVIIHDGGSSFIPWEMLHFKDECPAIGAGISRKFMTSAWRPGGRSNLPRSAVLKMLMVANPTMDLDGAGTEREMLKKLFDAKNGKVTVLSEREATKKAILQALASHEFDILHYAGHADFIEEDPSQSGVLCADGRLTSADLNDSLFAPQLVFLNGCESGRVRTRRGLTSGPTVRETLYDEFKEKVSLAEIILTSGVRNFIGTYWPVDDKAALRFSESFYSELLQGQPLGTALKAARQSTLAVHKRDWANYLHFGNPAYRLRQA